MTSHARAIHAVLSLFSIIIVSYFIIAVPLPAHAQNMAEGANMACNPIVPTCPCGKMINPDPQTRPQMPCIPGANMFMCPCENTTNGITTMGFCDAPMHCKAVSSGGSGVDSMLQQLGQMLGQALQKLGQGGGGGGGSQPPPSSGGGGTGGFGGDYGGGYDPCATTYGTTNPCTSNPYYTSSSGDLSGYNGTNTAYYTYNPYPQGTNTSPNYYTYNPYTAPTGSNPYIGFTGSLGNENPNYGTVSNNPLNIGGYAGGLPYVSDPYNQNQSQNPYQDPYQNQASNLNGVFNTGQSQGQTENQTQNQTQNQNQQGTTPAQNLNSLLGFITNPVSSLLNKNTNTNTGPGGSAPLSSTTDYSFFSKYGSQTGVTGADFASFSTIANIISGGPGGDIMVGPNGVTVRSSGTQGNTAISGFYGANSKSSSTSLAAWLCQTRPWASGFFSRIISASYFDNLCIKRGYQVGSLPTTPTASKTTQSVSSKTTQNPPIKVSTTTRATTTVIVSTSTVPVIPPKVQIWAVPPTVPIGSRTSVFWNTRGVKGCIVTSPDGSFYQTSLSGGASTVPLTTATTYTISCLAPDGTPVTDYFTVRMAI